MFNLSDWQAGVPIPPESPVAIAVFFSGPFNLPYSPKPHRSITTGIRQIKTRESSQALLFFSPDYSLFYSRFMRLFEKNGLLQTVTNCYSLLQTVKKTENCKEKPCMLSLSPCKQGFSVRKKRLELSRPCDHRHLKPARLPIPPLPRT